MSLKNTIENDKEKIKERKQERKKIRSLKAVEKLVLPNPFLLINNKAPKVFDAQVEYRIYSNKRPTSNKRPASNNNII